MHNLTRQNELRNVPYDYAFATENNYTIIRMINARSLRSDTSSGTIKVNNTSEDALEICSTYIASKSSDEDPIDNFVSIGYS